VASPVSFSPRSPSPEPEPPVLVPVAGRLTEADLQQAGEALRLGGLVAFPTDTVYGVGAHAGDRQAVGRLFEAKARPLHKPLPVLIAEVAELERYARSIPPAAWDLAARFWPGSLTLVLERTDAVCPEAVAGGTTVGLRVPDSAVARAVLRAAQVPVAVTSANPSGGPATVDSTEVARVLGPWLACLVAPSGPASGVPSTVLDLTVDPPRVLRLGGISREELQAVLGYAPQEGSSGP